jgi:hypothetical protein
MTTFMDVDINDNINVDINAKINEGINGKNINVDIIDIITLREICPKTVTVLLFFLMDNHQTCSNPITSSRWGGKGCIQ